jgi:mono/diheme cytochrome c family protein
MKKLLKVLGQALVILVLVAGCGVGYVMLALPKVAPADQTLKIESSPARLQRGEYLAKHVAACMGCHSQRDWTVYGHPIKAGTEWKGGEPLFDQRIGLPGVIQPKNLTPYNLKNYSDGELVRVIRTGVRKNGEPLFPFMPYQAFAAMEQEDLYSIIAYLRCLPEGVNDVAEHKLDPPLNVIVRTMPQEAGLYPAPIDRKDTVAYGRYLVKMGSCTDCHTPVNGKHEPLPGMYLAGGQEFPYLNSKLEKHAGGGVLRIPNITPDKETGIGNWSKKDFLARFNEWRGAAKLKAKHQQLNLDKGDYLPLMPYGEFAGMTDGDLGAIYDYLHSLPAVKHAVVRFEPPKI